MWLRAWDVKTTIPERTISLLSVGNNPDVSLCSTRTTTRADKTARRYHATLCLAATLPVRRKPPPPSRPMTRSTYYTLNGEEPLRLIVFEGVAPA